MIDEVLMETVIDGKRIIKTEDNIKIIPCEAPRGAIFRDRAEIYVFPHPVSVEERNKVYGIITK